MMRRLLPLIGAIVAVIGVIGGDTPVAVAQEPSAPSVVAEIDTGKLKGEPTQLAWSADGTQFFVQTSQRDGQGMIIKPRFYVLPASGGAPKAVDAPPAWAAEYWGWKSNKASPASPRFAIEAKEDYRQVSGMSAPMGGALARGGTPTDPTSGTTVEDVASHALQTQKQHVITLTLKGETIGEFVNTQFLPGYTFGWSPEPLVAVAYGNANGRLAVMDEKGTKREVAGTHNVILPAWSPDGKKIAFLQKTGKNKYDLTVVDVKP